MPGKSREYHKFMSQVDQSGERGCWIWKGCVNKEKYGVARMFGEILAHRSSYTIFIQPIEEGKIICHHCDVPSCVNPQHLFIGTHADNCHDKVQKGRARNRFSDATHCVNGHEFTPENTRIRKNSNRTCKQCEKIRHTKNKEKKYVNK